MTETNDTTQETNAPPAQIDERRFAAYFGISYDKATYTQIAYWNSLKSRS